MKQLEGGVTVDLGHREATPGTIDHGAGDRRDAPDSDLGVYGNAKWRLPGQGESGPGCGEWYPQSVCDTCAHTEYATRSCGRRSCPDCWGIWAKQAAIRATHRIQSFRETQPDDYRRQVAHAVVSPSQGDITTEREYWDGRSKAAEIAEEKGFRGFVIVPHPYRVTEAGKQRYREEDPDVGLWVWLRNDVEDMDEYIYWSPHYHIVGLTSSDMDGGADEDEWAYHFIRSLESYDGVRDYESHEDLYGNVRYILSHTGFPEESTKQVLTWYGDLANSVFVEDATQEWQNEKPSERTRERLKDAIEEVAGPSEEDDRNDVAHGVDDHGDCPCDDCDGVLIDVFDVRVYLRTAEPPPEVARRMRTANEWRLGRVEPPPGLKRPQSEEEARESFEAIL